jgi:hypothetical protein
MNSIVNNDKTLPISEENKDASLPLLQINPPSIMTSITSFQTVDDNQENILESTCIQRSPPSQTVDIATSPSDKFDRVNFQNSSSIGHMDEHSIDAWVQSTTTETISPPIERSPSLPATIFDQIASRSRGNSTVSTLCDQQQQQTSIYSDTMSSTISQNPSSSAELQRSYSFPTTDQHDNNDQENRLIKEENEDDFSSQFLAVPESEDSEIDKKKDKLPLLEQSAIFKTRSPTEEERKKSPNVSFHASVSFETPRKLMSHRRGQHSWNSDKNKSSLYQRSISHKIPTRSSLLYPKIIHKQFLTSSSMPTGTYSFPGNRTNQSSSLSDNVFLSTSTTNSPSSCQHLQLTNNTSIHPHFLSIPSSTSMVSSDRPTSNISDASGRSGIESSNLKTSASEPPYTASINEEPADRKSFFFLKHEHTSSASTGSSRTASTESLPTSSSEDEHNNFHKKLAALNKAGKSPQTPSDQRLAVLRQLMWLLEKRPTMNPRLNLGRQKQLQGTAPVNTNTLIFIQALSRF